MCLRSRSARPACRTGLSRSLRGRADRSRRSSSDTGSAGQRRLALRDLLQLARMVMIAESAVVGIDPAQCGDAGEVAVEGADGGAVFDGERGEVGVRDQVSPQIAVGQ